MSDNTFYWIGAAVLGYFVWQHYFAHPASGSTQYCKFPDGTYLTVPAGNSCPYDANHGGQSTLCPVNTFPTSYTGALPSGGTFC